MRLSCFLTFIAFASAALAQPRVDNVLERMVPSGATSLVGARMDQIKQTDLYRRMVASRSLTQVDQFAAETGFDPLRDVRELLLASTARGSVMLARGTFHPNPAALKNARRSRHGQYDIWRTGSSGFCFLDSTLAAAGELPVLEAALDEWTSGSHTAARPLLSKAAGISPQTQFWGVSTGAGNFLADHPPAAGLGIDFSKIFRGLEDTWFQADFAAGLHAEVHGVTATEKEAANLRDAVRGMVGLGRLNVPEDQPELLKAWDGITVDQQGRSISIHAGIPQNLIDRMVQMLNGTALRGRLL